MYKDSDLIIDDSRSDFVRETTYEIQTGEDEEQQDIIV